jgi:hypothetical protein
MRPYLEKKKTAGGVAQGVGPEFKPQEQEKKKVWNWGQRVTTFLGFSAGVETSLVVFKETPRLSDHPPHCFPMCKHSLEVTQVAGVAASSQHLAEPLYVLGLEAAVCQPTGGDPQSCSICPQHRGDSHLSLLTQAERQACGRGGTGTHLADR